MLKKSTFFCTKRDAYDDAEELSVVYGASYRRTYNTWGHAGHPLAYKIPPDRWAEGTWEAWAQWPRRCPGWFNLDAQPTNRPAFKLLPAAATAAATGAAKGGGAAAKGGAKGGGAAGGQGAAAAARRVELVPELPA